jgi:hypothetical protein
MTKRKAIVIAGLLVVALGGVPVLAQQFPSDLTIVELPRGTKNTASTDDLSLKATAIAAERLFPQARWKQTVVCNLDRPSEVQRYAVTCTGASRLDAHVADCCMDGDHWEAKIKNWDRAPNTGVTTSPGPANAFGVITRVYNYGGTPQNPGHISAEVDCSYIHGIDVFPAGSYIALSSDGNCSVTDLGTQDSINRTP